VNLSQFTLRDGKDPPPGVAIINPDVVEQACVDLEALLLQVLRTGRVDSPMLVQVSVASEGRLPVTYVTREFGRYGDPPVLPRLRPVTVEIPAGATEEETKPAAAELAAGVLNQFGRACRLSRGGQAGWSWWQQPWPRDRNGIGAAGLGPDRLPGSAAVACSRHAKGGPARSAASSARRGRLRGTGGAAPDPGPLWPPSRRLPRRRPRPSTSACCGQVSAQKYLGCTSDRLSATAEKFGRR
jgi:hypothetical protein